MAWGIFATNRVNVKEARKPLIQVLTFDTQNATLGKSHETYSSYSHTANG